MPSDVVTVGLVIIVFAVAASAVGITLWVKGQVSSAAEEAAGIAAGLAREFADYKLHVAETYMSKISGGSAIDRATAEMKGFRIEMKQDIAKLENAVAARLDRLEARLLNGTSPNGNGRT